jgi:hypothetical protein
MRPKVEKQKAARLDDELDAAVASAHHRLDYRWQGRSTDHCAMDGSERRTARTGEVERQSAAICLLKEQGAKRLCAPMARIQPPS